MIGSGQANGAYGLMFHRFVAAGAGDGVSGGLTAEQFERILGVVQAQGGRLLPAQEWLDRLDSGRLRPEDRCVTFDDGLRCQIDVALPVLEARDLTAFWFVYSGPVDGQPVVSEIWPWAAARLGSMELLIERVLTQVPGPLLEALRSPEFTAWATALGAVAPFYTQGDLQFRFLRNHVRWGDALADTVQRVLADAGVSTDAIGRMLWMDMGDWRTLADAGHHVGLHSHSHPHEMSRLSREQQYDEYSVNADWIRRATGRSPTSMSHPLNSYSEDTIEVLKAMGIRCGFRANLAPAGVAPAHLALPRADPALIPVGAELRVPSTRYARRGDDNR